MATSPSSSRRLLLLLKQLLGAGAAVGASLVIARAGAKRTSQGVYVYTTWSWARLRQRLSVLRWALGFAAAHVRDCRALTFQLLWCMHKLTMYFVVSSSFSG